jgi:hypothetical protein
VPGAGDDAVLNLVVLPHVEEPEPFPGVEARSDVLGRGFSDLGADLPQQIPEVRHVHTLL